MDSTQKTIRALRVFLMTLISIVFVVHGSTAFADAVTCADSAQADTSVPHNLNGMQALAKNFMKLTSNMLPPPRQHAQVPPPSQQDVAVVSTPAPARTPSATAGCSRSGTGAGSFYGNEFDGRRTASGQTFRQTGMTVAHRTLPFGTVVVIRDPASGKSVRATVTDRGPYAAGRIVDMSRAVFERLAPTSRGVLRNIELWTCNS